MSKENYITIGVLSLLIAVYIYLFISPTQPHLPKGPRAFVIQKDTEESFQAFLKEFHDAQNPWGGYYGSGYNYTDTFNYSSWGEWGGTNKGDDFFMNGYDDFKGSARGGKSSYKDEPNVPSDKYRCQEGWLVIRAEMNYKYLWMHAAENGWMGATATMDTPLHRRAFQVVPVNSNCSDGGWVRLREGDSKGFIMMVAPTGEFAIDEWVVKVGSTDLNETAWDKRYHFLLEEEGYLMNYGAMAFVNVMPEAEYSVRGHTGGWDRTKPAGREYGAMMHFQFVNDSLVEAAIEKEASEQKEADDMDKLYIKQIAAFPTSTEKRIISFGLYGAKEKYTMGAIRNAELAKTYFPGWICRFYVTSDVPEDVITTLKDLGSEIESVPAGMGYSSGMFWRFMVAVDPAVDRYIIRDVDSRLNARDRIAVEEWIDSKYKIHILRDHVNHCIVMNGGMWGGVKGAVPGMEEAILNWSSRDEYMADLHFLEKRIWPEIQGQQLAHDSYCCDRFPNTKPFPTQRSKTYQHVGQVFDSHDNPRLMDIDGFIRGVPIPGSCRKQADWIYG